MSVGLLFECDEQVVEAIIKPYHQKPFKFDKCIGIIKNNKLVGAVLFTNYNGCNVELSYFGQATMSVGVIRAIARYILYTFSPSRLTVLTSKRNRRYIKSFQKLGFRVEGIQRCYYGVRDSNRNTAVRFVMFPDRVREIARMGISTQQAAR